MLDKREIGLKLETSRGDPLFLNTGITLEILRTEGKTPEVNELLISAEIGTDIS